MNIKDILNSADGSKHFSFEVLPPLKGTGTERLFSTIEKFKDFNPAYINITTHHSEYVYREVEGGQYERLRLRRRPGTVAIAAAIQNKFGIPVIPHVICSGASAFDIEYELIDLQFLGIENLLLLRGDKAKEDSRFMPTPGGYSHTTELIEQVNRFNEGFFNDGTPIKNPTGKFGFGVACYPEKHEEAPNIEMDMEYLKQLRQLGKWLQSGNDWHRYAHCTGTLHKVKILLVVVEQLRNGIVGSEVLLLLEILHIHLDICALPQELAQEVLKCKTDDDARQLGIEWTTEQCRQLYAAGVHNIHFYTVSAVDSVREVAKRLL